MNRSGILLAQSSAGVATIALAVSFTGLRAPTLALLGLSTVIGVAALAVTWFNLRRFK
jgi:hypothetical protein